MQWKDACRENHQFRRQELTTWEFQAILEEELTHFVDRDSNHNDATSTVETDAIDMVLHGHCPIEADKSQHVICCVCKIEENILDRLKVKKNNARAKRNQALRNKKIQLTIIWGNLQEHK